MDLPPRRHVTAAPLRSALLRAKLAVAHGARVREATSEWPRSWRVVAALLQTSTTGSDSIATATMLRFLAGSFNGRGRVVYSVRDVPRRAITMAVSRDAACIVVAYANERALTVYSTESDGAEPRSVAGFTHIPNALSFAPDDRLYVLEPLRVSVLAPRSFEREAGIEDLACCSAYDGDAYWCAFGIATSADALIIVHYHCGMVTVFNRVTLVRERTFTVQTPPNTKMFSKLALICRGSVLAAPISYLSVNLCDLDGNSLRIIECGNLSCAGEVAWSEDDELVAVTYGSGYYRLIIVDTHGRVHCVMPTVCVPCSIDDPCDYVCAFAVRNGVVYAVVVDTFFVHRCVSERKVCTTTIVEFCGGVYARGRGRPFALRRAGDAAKLQ